MEFLALGYFILSSMFFSTRGSCRKLRKMASPGDTCASYTAADLVQACTRARCVRKLRRLKLENSSRRREGGLEAWRPGLHLRVNSFTSKCVASSFPADFPASAPLRVSSSETEPRERLV